MKKIALLFTVLCAGALNGMEQTPYESLPKELKQEIIMKALETSNDLDEAIEAIKATSAFYKIPYDTIFNDQTAFAGLAHMLANKFDTTTETVAEEFGTPAAKNYLDLGNQLNAAIASGKFNIAKQFIKKGADVNYPAEILISVLKNYTADGAIKDLKKRSETNHALHKMLYEEHGDQKGFTVLVHALKNLFKVDVESLYYKLNTPPAIISYDHLGNLLISAVKNNNINDLIKLIKQHADVNYDAGPIEFNIYNTDIPPYENITPFDLAVILGYAEIAQELLDAGAVPKPDDYYVSPKHHAHTGFFATDEDIDTKEKRAYKKKIKETLSKLTKK
ncbi:MAG TPA: hypothetical protein VJ201_06225 [Candidatus Babeliales bacterium]|nr:hypothetical protein [Candidatus Babeliales bacterium]